MTKEIIYTENYALIVDDSEIKDENWVFVDCTNNPDEYKGKEVIRYMTPPCSPQYWGNKKWCKKIIFHKPLNGSKELEGVPLLPEMEDMDVSHLKWIYERMVHVHGENENYDYMLRFKSIIQSIKQSNRPKYFEFEINKWVDELYCIVVEEPKTELINSKITAVGKYKS